jgi:preprotein translocase subunit SecG
MKTFLKRTFYIFAVSFMLLTLGSSYFSHKLTNELEQMNEIYHENDYLTDAALVCMQLYALNPSKENKETCLKIEEEINNNHNALKNFMFASIYFEYLDKN